jgi:hypothetical protein
MLIWDHAKHSEWHAIFISAAISIAVNFAAVDPVHAQGFFDFLFGGPQQRPVEAPGPDAHPPPAPGIGRISPAPLGQENVNENAGSTGHSVAFCVRLCDGQHFPLERTTNGTAVETCRAICPYSGTKVFFGSEIVGAVAEDGQKYTNLDTAFVYRKRLVANCSCNGKNAFGLASFDVKSDPTLRPGDIVSTKEGLLNYTGKAGQAAAFAPVNPATLPFDVSPSSAQQLTPPRATPTPGDRPGTIAQPQKQQIQKAPLVANPQGYPAQ